MAVSSNDPWEQCGKVDH